MGVTQGTGHAWETSHRPRRNTREEQQESVERSVEQAECLGKSIQSDVLGVRLDTGAAYASDAASGSLCTGTGAAETDTSNVDEQLENLATVTLATSEDTGNQTGWCADILDQVSAETQEQKEPLAFQQSLV